MFGLIAALAVAGIVLLLVEIFVIPGFGVSGILGIGALIAAIVIAANSVVEAVMYTLLAIVIVGIMVYIAFRNNRLQSKLFLKIQQSTRQGYLAAKPNFEQLKGREGVAITPLRPAGTADFGGVRIDVVTEGGFIKKGAAITVLAVEGARVVVREVQEKRD